MQEVELSSLNGSGAQGKAEFKQSIDEDIEIEVEIEVENAPAGTYNLIVGGVVVGQIVVDSSGEGEVEFSTNSDEVGELSLPSNLPDIVAGTVVEIEGIASGTLVEVPVVNLDGNFVAGPSVPGAKGQFEYRQQTDETRLVIEVEDLPEGTYEVRVNSFLIATLDVDNNGEGELALQAEGGDGDGDGDGFPPGFPGINAGDTVTIGGNLLTFTLPAGA